MNIKTNEIADDADLPSLPDISDLKDKKLKSHSAENLAVLTQHLTNEFLNKIVV